MQRVRCSSQAMRRSALASISLSRQERRDMLALRRGTSAQRLYMYGRPGVSQRTNIRLNGVLRDELANGEIIDVYLAKSAGP